jgi:competence protein ComEC
MSSLRWIRGLTVLAGVFAVASSALSESWGIHALAANPRMRVHFIDVGQGSATLLEFKCGAVLVDSGGARDKKEALNAYLDAFFAQRPDLHKTLSTVFLTHDHMDHSLGLEGVAKRYRVLHMVDDGIRKDPEADSGLNRMMKVLAQATPPVTSHAVTDAMVRSAGVAGLSDADIDPVACADCDPELKVLAGGQTTKPAGWTSAAFKNLNNHSLVIRASLGKASILITGDLEIEGIKRLTDFYGPGDVLASEILVAGHHGSENGMTPDLVRLVAPQIAAISCGMPNDGFIEGSANARPNTAYIFGHPSQVTVETLEAGVARSRPPIEVQLGLAAMTFTPKEHKIKISKAIYCTGWEGSFVVDAYANGRISVRKSGLVSGLIRRSAVARR